MTPVMCVNLRQSQPRWCPTLHQEPRTFVPQRLFYDPENTLHDLSAVNNMIAFESLTSLTPLTDTAFCTLLFKTSAGAQTVVATVPATDDARKCVMIPSFRFTEWFDSNWRFAAE